LEIKSTPRWSLRLLLGKPPLPSLPSGSRTRKLSPSVHSSGSNTQPLKRSNGLAGGAFCAIAAAVRQTSAIKTGNIGAQHDPLASHIFVSRRHYQNLSDTKSGKRRAISAQLSWQTACGLGFRGNLNEWERLMGAAARR
jgi:hypothetical protein